MRTAEWILTFDDGPLPADITRYRPGDEDKLLAPLKSILDTLVNHWREPIPAVFFLRGPGYPWKRGEKPPKSLFRRGVQMILSAGHHAAIHAYRHDPKLWWGWLFRGPQIHADLDKCMAYFEPMVGQPIRLFRPPYGQGGLPGLAWTAKHHVRHRLWDIDTEDWLHHPDADDIIRRFERPNQAAAHLKHILDWLPLKMWRHTWWPGPNDFLLHVSVRTARFLPEIIDAICKTTHRQRHEPRFVAPDWYLVP